MSTLTHTLQQVLSCIQSLHKYYEDLRSCIEAEHTFIKKGLYDEQFEENCRKKIFTVQEIETLVTNLLKEFPVLREFLIQESYLENLASNAQLSFSEYIALLEKAELQIDDISLKSLLQKTIQAAKNFYELSKAVKPRIEVNALALQQLVYNYQQSLRFFNEVQSELEAPYDASGTKKITTERATFEVKA